MTTEVSRDELNTMLFNQINGIAESEGKNEDTEEEPVETSEVVETEVDGSEPQAEETKEDTQENSDDGSGKPKKSNVPKLLSERNKFRNLYAESQKDAEKWKKIALESKTEDGEETQDSLDARSRQITAEMIADARFYENNVDAIEHKEKIEEYKATHNLDIERAYKLFLIEEKPDDLLAIARKQSSKKIVPPAVVNTKLRTEKSPQEL